jgi:hypothetical protein
MQNQNKAQVKQVKITLNHMPLKENDKFKNTFIGIGII